MSERRRIHVARKGDRPVHPPDTKAVFGDSTCFLCHRRLGRLTRSEEHVVPKWIQSRFNLRDQQLFLLNGTSIPYKLLKVPCCQRCNNDHLSALEGMVRDAVHNGHQALRQVDRYGLFLWLGKIFYGILRKELSLLRDRRRPKAGKILPRQMLEQFRLLHFLLQGARAPMKIAALQPEVRFPLGSIFIVKTQLNPEPLLQFDLRDALYPFCISLMLGEVGIIAALGDGGTIDVEFEDLFARIGDHALHPIQFAELVAAVFYKASLFNRQPRYVIDRRDDDWIVTQDMLQGLTTRPMFDDWNVAHFAQLLARHTHRSVEEVNPMPGTVRTWLHDDTGALPFIDLRMHAWPDRLQPEPVPLRRGARR